MSRARRARSTHESPGAQVLVAEAERCWFLVSCPILAITAILQV